MKAYVERPEGRWLPSRYRYAIFRLTAFLLLRRSAPYQPATPERRYALIIDRDQNPIESFALSLFLVTWSSACASIAATRYAGVRPALAAGLFPILLVIMPFILQVVLYVVGGLLAVFRRVGLPVAEANHGVQTATFFLVMLAAATIVSTSGRPALAILGWSWFALLGINGAAALMMRLLAKPVAAAEARLREGPSEL